MRNTFKRTKTALKSKIKLWVGLYLTKAKILRYSLILSGIAALLIATKLMLIGDAYYKVYLLVMASMILTIAGYYPLKTKNKEEK